MRTCQRCGTDLGPRPEGRHGPDPKYCDACRTEVRRAVRDATRPPPRRLSLPPRSCQVCGSAFTPIRRAQVYCSRKCRYHAIYEARKATGRIPTRSVRHLVCADCGSAFVQAGTGRPRRYCSAQCAKNRGRQPAS